MYLLVRIEGTDSISPPTTNTTTTTTPRIDLPTLNKIEIKLIPERILDALIGEEHPVLPPTTSSICSESITLEDNIVQVSKWGGSRKKNYNDMFVVENPERKPGMSDEVYDKYVKAFKKRSSVARVDARNGRIKMKRGAKRNEDSFTTKDPERPPTISDKEYKLLCLAHRRRCSYYRTKAKKENKNKK